jgi:hypothetical protein
MKRRIEIADESGTTLVELMVATAAGLVVLSALSMVILVSLHASTRVSARVHATQNAQLALEKIMSELHSACVAPKMSPVQAESTGTTLILIHAAPSEGTQLTPKPIRSVISLSGGKLSQTDFAATTETQPWGFSKTAIPPGTRQLATGISPIPPNTWIFSYYAYANGQLSETRLPDIPELNAIDATHAVEVRVALNAAPSSVPTTEKNAAASVQNSAVLRLTPPSYNELAESLPCQ